MNRKQKLLILILLSLSVYFVYKITDNRSFTYTVLGDSFSNGKNSYGGYTYGYEDYILDYLKKDRIVQFIDFYASNNENINTLYNKLLKDDIRTINNKNYNLKRILTESDIVTISVGLNDILYECYIDKTVLKSQYKEDKVVEFVYKNFKNLIDELIKYTSNIYVIGYPERNEYKNLIKKLNVKYKKYCKNEKIIFIDSNKLLNKSNYFDNVNTIFPNTKGYKKISEKIIKIYKNKEKA